jgi:hypothetical protein
MPFLDGNERVSVLRTYFGTAMKNSLLVSIVVSVVLSLSSSSAQMPILMSAGYASPSPMLVPPGQILTLYLSGTKTVLPVQSSTLRATTVPLPIILKNPSMVPSSAPVDEQTIRSSRFVERT